MKEQLIEQYALTTLPVTIEKRKHFLVDKMSSSVIYTKVVPFF